ncbi:MAG: ATP-binding protein [Cyanobacteria bacterium P01_C01_bin.120]
MTALDFIAETRAAIAAITDSKITTAAVDINNCDREPIHIPAAIQPHGLLLVMREADWQIVQASQNVSDYLGRSLDAVLHQPLSEILTATQIQALEQCLAKEFETVNPLRFEIWVGEEIRTFSAVAHRTEAAVILELELVADQEVVSFFDFYRLVKRPVSQIQQTQTLEELCQSAVETVAQISGFDRVMIYQFDEDGSGSVIAEAKRDDLTPYLGLHYPPTDIPKQAKYLYLLNLLRLIPDVDYEPVPLVPDRNPLTGRPLDMSLSSLRSVSPLHTEYLTNMGVQATMAISLVHNRQLWGMVVCHHGSPRQVSQELRTVCEFLGQVISLELSNRQDSTDTDYRLAVQALQANFIESLTQSQSLQAALGSDPQRLMALVKAGGVALCEQGNITLMGQTPEAAAMPALLHWLQDQFKEDVVYQTSNLSDRYAAAEEFSGVASGLLAIVVSRVQQIYILWFRPEVLQTINWAGNPTKPVEVDGAGELRMSPRKSFEQWKETVHRRSLPWKTYDIEAALELRSTVIGLVLQKADELAQLNTELERSNVELDAFAYFASHDLKEPLRGIHNYSSFLIEDYGEQLGEDGAEKLNTLMRLTQRMEDLINSLLHYSRLGRADLQMATVNLQKLVTGVVDVLKISKPEQVDFQIPRELPVCKCDRTLITELFTNLISNAIKYNSEAHKSIEIGYLQPAEIAEKPPWSASVKKPAVATVFYVRDNGIGIRPKHLDTIFRIFKRLHSPQRFGGGTGVGLTIVKKIVERHGGQIWVDSVYGEGTIFYFTLEGHTHD